MAVAAIDGAIPLMAWATIDAGLMAGVWTRMSVGSSDTLAAGPALGFGLGVAFAAWLFTTDVVGCSAIDRAHSGTSFKMGCNLAPIATGSAEATGSGDDFCGVAATIAAAPVTGAEVGRAWAMADGEITDG